MGLTTLHTFLGNVYAYVLNPFIVLLFAIAAVYFLWGVLGLVTNTDNEQARNDSKKHVLWGVIGLFIMMSVFGIMCMIANTFQLPSSITQLIPLC